MRSYLLVAVLVLPAVAAVAYTQSQPPAVPPLPSPPVVQQADPAPPPAAIRPPEGRIIPPQSVPVAPKEPTVDEMLDSLERLRAQKAEIEKREQELVAAIRRKIEKQAERLERLGVAPRPAAATPDRVGRIVIVGASGEAEKRIVKLVGLTPGEVLNYPALAEAQRKLGLAGFPGASVQPHPSENGSGYVDVVVRVAIGGDAPVVPKLPSPPG